MLLLNKKGGGLKLFVDYHALNRVGLKKRYTLFRVKEVYDQPQGARQVTKGDPHSGFHQIRLECYFALPTAFRTRCGHFEFLILPFGPTDAPTKILISMNAVLKEYVAMFEIVHLDNFFVYSKTQQ